MGEIRECFLHGLYTTDECLDCSPDPKPVSAEELAEMIHGEQYPGLVYDSLDRIEYEGIAAAILEKYRVERR